ncbi:MAG: adenylosuccinate synthase [Myxococcota bacterium]|nr:adenylosuccinate synthase [Myxococcota bacterium]
MANTVVVGLQWGDEGKGKVVDRLAEHSAYVVRFQGGNNAGHTLVVNGEKIVLHVIPSGILHPKARCVVGNGVVVDPEVMVEELDQLAARGRDVTAAQLAISRDAHVIMPWHRVLDACREDALGKQLIGTTRKGIGPTYEDKVARRGIKVADLMDPVALRRQVSGILPEKNRQIVEWYSGEPLTIEEIESWAAPFAERLRPFVCDTVELLHAASRRGEAILFEGAQGTFLDVDHGTYPFVTSSNTVAGGACAGTGVGPRDVHAVVGIVKAYATRVGTGPFPTELHGEMGEKLRTLGGEYGATTGRPRRCGWFDAALVRRAVQLNGVTHLTLTKLDILGSFDHLCIGTGYAGSDAFPAHDLDGAEPVYEVVPGWRSDISLARTWDDLPTEAQHFVTRIEALVGVPVVLIGVGPGRAEVVERVDPIAALTKSRR